MAWSVTWEKAAFIILIVGLFLGFACRHSPKLHVTIMSTSILGLICLFSWIVIERFAFPHASVQGRPPLYWALFITHVVSGLLVILAAGLQGMSGGLMLGGAGGATARRFHRRCGFFTVAMAIISLLSVLPI